MLIFIEALTLTSNCYTIPPYTQGSIPPKGGLRSRSWRTLTLTLTLTSTLTLALTLTRSAGLAAGGGGREPAARRDARVGAGEP